MNDLGTLTGGANSSANAANAVGDVVVGTSTSISGVRAFRWTQAGGMADLGVLTGGAFSIANGVNAVGDVVVGQSGSTLGDRAFRWTQAGGMVSLGVLAGGASSVANGVNAAGDVVVGQSGSTLGNRAFRWTQAGGMVSLGVLAGGIFSAAYGVNAAGDVVVGESVMPFGDRAFRWTQAGGMVDLGVLAGGTSSEARGVNAAGDVVVGQSGSTQGLRAFRWTQAGGMVSLGVLAGGITSIARGVNAAGDVVVGDSDSTLGVTAFRWTQAVGMQTVEQWLADHGVVVSGAKPVRAFGVNAAGDVVVGSLTNNHAFIAHASSAGVGLIDVPDFNRTLQTSAYVHTALNRNTDLILSGLQDSLSRGFLPPTRVDSSRGFLPPTRVKAWVSGDLAHLDHGDDNGQALAGEFGLGVGVTEGVEASLALGQQHARNETTYNGQTTLNQSYIASGLRFRIPSSAMAIRLNGYYGSGTVDVDRGYLNAGTPVFSRGSPDAYTVAMLVRGDWMDAWSAGPALMTPYASLSWMRSEVDAYTESGGGFPVHWNARKETAQLLRVGNDAVWAVSSQTNVLGRVEYVRPLNRDSKEGEVSGRVVGLYGFSFDAEQAKKDWLRVGLGSEHKVDSSSSVKAMLNATSESEAPSMWVHMAYQKVF